MSLDDLDPVLTAPKRLAALSILANSREVEFAFLRDHLRLGDSDLSKQMSALVAAGYATVRKDGKGRGRRTWFAVTDAGRRATERHVKALEAIVSAQAPEGGD